MNSSELMHSTFVIEREYPVSPERVYRAFEDPAQKRKWHAEGKGSNLVEYSLEFRVGGTEKTVSKFGPGLPLPEGTEMIGLSTYQYLVPGSRIVFAYTMTVGGNCISASLATIELFPSGTGTRLKFTDQGAYFEGADGPQMRSFGWESILANLGEFLK